MPPLKTQDKRNVWKENPDSPIWDYRYKDGNRPPPPAKFLVTATGSDFGDGPEVLIFDQFIGEHGQNAFRAPDVGAWDAISSYGESNVRLWFDPATNRTWFSCRDINKIAESGKHLVALFKRHAPTAKFRLSHRAWVPPTHCFPGMLVPQTMTDRSTWKFTWNGQDNGGSSLIGRAIPYRNLCIPSQIGSGSISVGGNSNGPAYWDGYKKALYGNWSFASPTLYSYYQDGVGAANVYDTPCELISINVGTGTRRVEMCDPFASENSEEAFTNRSYNALTFPGWFGSAPNEDYTNCLPLEADFYMAIGENSRAMILVSNVATFPAAGKTYQAVQVSWTASSIVFELDQHIIDDIGESFYVHLILADGTVRQNVTKTVEIK